MRAIRGHTAIYTKDFSIISVPDRWASWLEVCTQGPMASSFFVSNQSVELQIHDDRFGCRWHPFLRSSIKACFDKTIELSAAQDVVISVSSLFMFALWFVSLSDRVVATRHPHSFLQTMLTTQRTCFVIFTIFVFIAAFTSYMAGYHETLLVETPYRYAA